MRILHIIGNGFDINLGLRTRYSEFYEYLNKASIDSAGIQDLNKAINEDRPNWADLEVALGKHLKNIRSLGQFDDLFNNLTLSLSQYLSEEEKNLKLSEFNLPRFENHLCHPENALRPADFEAVRRFKNKWKSHGWLINIVTLNYTRTIEKLLKDQITNYRIGKHNNSVGITLQSVQHIHGYTNDRMIIGVNDTSQVENPNLINVPEIMNAVIKSNSNKSNKYEAEVAFKREIEAANLYCLFGSSIGPTDKMWWEAIGKRLLDDSRLIIYDIDKKANPILGHLNGRKEEEIRDKFLSMTNLSSQEQKKVRNNIYIGINTEMFALKEPK
ncbi:AbiH family protein [Flagellimonas sp.]|jgi:hypothetical protein|uniref:AbiH family protein n=1 Tax=Flagellimonas sp. TaxID=2058762 RepID=UPI003BAC7AE2